MLITGHFETTNAGLMLLFFKSNALGEAVQLNNAIAALFLLTNAEANSTQKLSMFSEADFNDTILFARLPLNDLFKTSKYVTVAIVLRQYAEEILVWEIQQR